MNLKAITKSALNIVFNLSGDSVKDAVYYRPASFNPRTGGIQTNEVTAPVKVIHLRPKAIEFRNVQYYPGDEKALIRASELTAIVNPGPAPGDFIMDTMTGQRCDIVMVEKDQSGELYTFQLAPSIHEDFG